MIYYKMILFFSLIFIIIICSVIYISCCKKNNYINSTLINTVPPTPVNSPKKYNENNVETVNV
jgi:hypothetical protein